MLIGVGLGLDATPARAHGLPQPTRVLATATASGSVLHPWLEDPAGRLRVGGADGWRALLRFRVATRPPRGGRVVLRLFALRPPTGRLLVRTIDVKLAWQEERIGPFAPPPPGRIVGHRAATPCGTHCGRGQWLSIDVTRAVRRRGTVELAVTSSSSHTLKLASRDDSRRAPRLWLSGPTTVPAVAPPALTVPGPVPEPAAGRLPLVAAAGDIACAQAGCGQQATADVVTRAGPDIVLPLGDLQYEVGALSEFQAHYDPSWGVFKPITYPAPGNHEYGTSAAKGYFDYFNGPGVVSGQAGERGRGYYSFDFAGWHVVALNSNCGHISGGCNAGSPQESWLRADLAAHPRACTLAYWHHPRFSSGTHGNTPSVQPLWQALHDAGAELVLSGHDHDYERLAPQTATGALDHVRGIREFVVGTGGRALRAFGTPLAHSEVRDSTSWGVLLLTLRADGYDWSFEPVAGHTFTDRGSGSCH